jgi:hypothetical protein
VQAAARQAAASADKRLPPRISFTDRAFDARRSPTRWEKLFLAAAVEIGEVEQLRGFAHFAARAREGLA